MMTGADEPFLLFRMLLASAKRMKWMTPDGEKWDNQNGEPIASLRCVPKGKERSFTRGCIIEVLKEAGEKKNKTSSVQH